MKQLNAEIRRAPLGTGKKNPNIIYALRAGKFVKFGITSSLKIRIKGLQSGSPCTLELLGYIDGSRGLERFIHECLKHQQSYGEWFHYTGHALAIAHFMSKPNLHWRLKPYLEKISGLL